MKKRSKKLAQSRAAAERSLPVLNSDAAGIDIGSEWHYVAVPEGRDSERVRRFGCYTTQLREMAAWLKACGVKTVAMESTGVYWIPVFEVLEDEGFEVLLIDARKLKNVSGRKSDVSDCEWIQRLHSYGLLSASFRPSREIVILRSYWRHREGLVESCSRHILLMQKALEQMNVQLHKAVSDITGVTGMSIIRKIVSGERNPQVLAALRQPGVKRSTEEIAQALTGTYREEHVFALQQALEGHDFLQGQIKRCDEQIERYMASLASVESRSEAPAKRTYRRKNQAHFDLAAELHRIVGVNITCLPGFDALNAQRAVTECGTDMTRFPTEQNFASWLHLCPDNRITGGAIKSTRTRRGKSRAASVFCLAAQSLLRSQGALGARARRLKARLGPPKAITAVAHHLALLFYRLLRYGQAYVDRGQESYELQQREQNIRTLKRKAARLGLALLDPTTGELIGAVS
jgi:transposase